MTNNIKVAVIGAGMMGKNHIKTYKTLQGVELVGVYDIFPEAAKAAADMFGIKAFASMEDVAKEVDAVSVVTTSVTHADVGEFFLNKGIHCLMEKPLATTEEGCQRLINAAKNNNVTLLVGHIEQFNPAVELSYLTPDEQQSFLDYAEAQDCTPSLSQAQKLKAASKDGTLTLDKLEEIMSAQKPSVAPREPVLNINVSNVAQYFPTGCTKQQMENRILKILESYFRQMAHEQAHEEER